MKFRTLSRCCAALALAAAAACSDDAPLASSPTPESPSDPSLLRLECVGSRVEGTVRCGVPAPSGVRGDLVLGGQGEFVKMTSSGVLYSGGQFTFFLTLQNLIGQPLGTTDGTTVASGGIRVFFATGPIVTQGTGTITVVADGTGTFTEAGQPYYAYHEIVKPGATSSARKWRLDMPATVETFAFSLYVSAPVRWQDGWIDLGPTRTVGLNQATPLGAVVRDRLGRALPGEPVTFSSSNTAVATVDASGTVTGTSTGTTTITATSGGRGGTLALSVGRAVNNVLAFGGQVLVPATLQVSTLLQDSSGNFLTGRSITWTSSDTTIAKVSATGLVTGIAPGVASITASVEGKSGSANVTVNTAPAGIVKLSRVQAGTYFSCGLAPDGAAYCWGPNLDGNLGNGNIGSSGADYRNAPDAVIGGLHFTALSVSARACGLVAGGAAYCWGNNDGGSLGVGDTVHRVQPTAVSGGIAFAVIAAGRSHTCGISTSHVAYCWGKNNAGQLGTGDNTDSYVPVPVAGGVQFDSISTSWDHTCALTAAGAAYCWGDNYQFSLGDGTSTARNTPRPVVGGFTFVQLSVGQSYTCAVTAAGAGYCWGDNSFSTLGNGQATSTYSSTVPVPVSGNITWARMAAGTRHASCGIDVSGNAWCWGRNDGFMLLGTSTNIGSSTVPARVAGGLAFAQLSGGFTHTCGVTTAGWAYCWGPAVNGANGDGTYTGRGTATPIAKGAIP